MSMKSGIIATALMLVAALVSHASGDREFTTITLDVECESHAEAKNWSLRNLDFEEWLKAVSRPEWTELHKEKTDDFYFAVYRSGAHVIFCHNDRHHAYRRSETLLRAVDDAIICDAWEAPSMWTYVNWNITYPRGKTHGGVQFLTWKMADGFSGDMILRYKMGNEGQEDREVFRHKFFWSPEAKQNGAATPSTPPKPGDAE